MPLITIQTDGDNKSQPHNNRVTISIQKILTPSKPSLVEENESEPAPAVTQSTKVTNWPDARHLQQLKTQNQKLSKLESQKHIHLEAQKSQN